MKKRAPKCPPFNSTPPKIRFIKWSQRTKAIGRKRDKYELLKQCSSKLPNFCSELMKCKSIHIAGTTQIQIHHYPHGQPKVLMVTLDLNAQTMELMPGFRWNGCSRSPDCCNAMNGCMFHDALYQLLQMRHTYLPGLKYCASKNSDFQKLREAADKDMRDIMMGNNFRYAGLYFQGVRTFGNSAARLCKQLP